MRKFLLTGAFALLSLLGKAQFTQSDLIYYVGEGPDTAVMVVDFLDGSADPAYAWGYLFDATDVVTGGDMLAAVATDEAMLTIVTGGGFLNDITYNAHIGLAGDPNYWGTWSKTGETVWALNTGLGEVLANGDWFGCSYTDFDPAVEPNDNAWPAYQSNKFMANNAEFWVGTGNDSAIFVVDFVTDVYGEAVSYAWGYAFDGTTDGATILADISAADVNLDVNAGAFLNDIIYNDLAGMAGEPNYWGTWSGTNLSDWTMNMGISTEVNDGDWFGCSYADWPPRRPFYPIAALDSAAFVSADIDFIVGEGTNKAVIVIDFNERGAGESYAFGYLFDTETITAEEVLTAIGESDVYGVDVAIAGGFLNDIVYYTGLSGIGGAPYYWSTWSGSNIGGWALNSGLSEIMSDGDWFACSYTAWAPATPPGMPENAANVSGITENNNESFTIYPNPAKSTVNIVLNNATAIQIIDLQGRIVYGSQLAKGINKIDVSNLQSGVYFIVSAVNGETVKEKLIIE